MRAAVDLHIHSCLSPCGDDMMTPNNIVNMALLKELDIIAVTDHNSVKNLPAVLAVAKEAGLPVLPGIEACSQEEVHTLCYFADLEGAMAFGEAVYPYLPPLPNNPAKFGAQQVMDAEDEETATEPRLLIQALDLPLDELVALCREMGGIAVPAHINRQANSLLYQLGFLPPGVPFSALEVARPPVPPPSCSIDGWKVLHSSDAHRLEDIAERDFFIDGLRAMSAKALFEWIKGEVEG